MGMFGLPPPHSGFLPPPGYDRGWIGGVGEGGHGIFSEQCEERGLKYLEIVEKVLTIRFNMEEMERLDFLLCEAKKSDNLCDYDREYLASLRALLQYERGI